MVNLGDFSLCRCVEIRTVGRRNLLVICGRKRRHDGKHYDSSQAFSWEGPEVYIEDIEWPGDWLKSTKKTKRKRKKGWATTKDLLVKRGAKRDVLEQHREEQEWKFLGKQEPPQRVLPFQPDLAMSLDVEPYYGEW